MNEQFMPSKAFGQQPRSAGPSLLACLLCRHKHLKCDGMTPVCSRCATANAECQYTPSRRGYKGPSKKRRANPSPEEEVADITPPFDPNTVGLYNVANVPVDWNFQSSFTYMPTTATLPASTPSESSIFAEQSAATAQQQQLLVKNAPLTPESSTSIANDGYLVDIYYQFFHPSHPILPQIRFLYQGRGVPAFLEQLIKFIGAHFTPAASSETYRPTVMSNVMEQGGTVEKVQALVLLAIVLHSRNERPQAGECLATAVDLSFELGMHTRDFAILMGEGDPVREECLRRTWWELFIIEGMLTALGVQPEFRLSKVPLEVPLPCEDRIYQEGLVPPPPPTIAQFDDRVFADEERDFSSYTYRIEAARVLGKVVSIQDLVEGQQEQVESIDARITSFFHHLPESKAELLRPDGTVDELMFQARMVINGTSIYLHFPRSDLLSSPTVAAEVICGHHGPCSIPAFSHHSHAMKAVKAASEISSLASTPMPVVKHTPFFICSLVMSSIVQLAACSVKAGQMPSPSRDKLSLTIGVFKTLSNTWAISQSIMRQIKAVARDVMDMGLRPAMDQIDLNTVLDHNGRFWLPDVLPR